MQFGFCELKTSAELAQGLPANYSDYSAITGQGHQFCSHSDRLHRYLALVSNADKQYKLLRSCQCFAPLTLSCWLPCAVPFISGYTGAPLGTSSSGAPLTEPTVTAADRGL